MENRIRKSVTVLLITLGISGLAMKTPEVTHGNELPEDEGIVVVNTAHFDVSEANYLGDAEKLDLSGEVSVLTSLTFSADGTKLFVTDRSANSVNEYSLSTAFDVSTAIYAGDGERLILTGPAFNAMVVTFNDDGTKLYAIGDSGDFLNEYSLSTAYDVSTATYAGDSERLFIGNDLYYGASFNTDGTKLFILDVSNDEVREYALTTAFDVSTASYAGDAEKLSNGVPSSSRSMTFNTTGTKLYILGSQDVYEFSLSTAFDVSTATYNGDAERLNTSISGSGIVFNSTGDRLFVANIVPAEIHEFTLDNDIPTLVSADKDSDTQITVTLSEAVKTNGGNPTDFVVIDCRGINYAVTAQADGTVGDRKIVLTVSSLANAVGDLTITYTNNNGEVKDLANNDLATDNVGVTIALGGISHAFDVSEAIDLGSAEKLDISAQIGNLSSFTFNNDGTKLFGSDRNSHAIYEYDLSVAFDVSTAVYAGDAERFDIPSPINTVMLVRFNADGTKMYLTGDSNQFLYEYSLSTAFDVSTASYNGDAERLDLGSGFHYGVGFNNDGTKLFDMEVITKEVKEYNLSTAFDISTAIYAGDAEKFTAGFTGFSRALTFNDDGTKMYLFGSNTGQVYEYDLSTAFDVSTAVYAGDAERLFAGSGTGIMFSNNGEKFFSSTALSAQITEYSLLEADVTAPTLTSATKDSDTQITITLSENITVFGANPTDFTVRDGDGNSYLVNAIADGTVGDDKVILTVADVSGATSDLTITYANNNNEVADLNCNNLATDSNGVGINIADPKMVSATRDNNTTITITFSEIIQTNGTNPTDFAVTDALSNTYEVSAQLDGTSNDNKIVLTVADLSNSAGVLTITYANNNAEITGLESDQLATDAVGVMILDSTVPTLNNATKDSDTQITLTLSEIVQTNGTNPTDFMVTDCRGNNYAVTAQTDGTAHDKKIVLTVTDISAAVGDITVTYTNNNNEISDFGGNFLATDIAGVVVSGAGSASSFDVSTAVSAGDAEKLDISAQIGNLSSFTFNNDGTKLFGSDRNSHAIYEYDLSVAFDVSTAVYAGDAERFDIPSPINTVMLVRFNADGTKMYLTGDSNQFLYEYSLSTAFDVSTASYNGDAERLDLGSGFHYGVSFNNDGTKLFDMEVITREVKEYNLSTAFDISTAIYAGDAEKFTADFTGFSRALTFNDDGTKMYLFGSNTGQVYEYDLSTAFDVSTAVYAGDAERFFVGSGTGIAFNTSGDKFFSSTALSALITEYNLALPDDTAPTLSGATKDSNTQITLTFSENVTVFGVNVGDFMVKDGQSNTYAVSAIADGTAGDDKIVLTVADFGGATTDITITYTNNNDEVADLNCNNMATDLIGVGINVSNPTMVSATRDNNTTITITLSENVQTSGTNPDDFTVTDGLNNTFAVSAQADGTAGDNKIVLTVADMSNAVGDLTITYTNNNGEIQGLTGDQMATDPVGVIIDDTVAPTLVSATRDSHTQLTVALSEPVQIVGANPSDFILKDSQGAEFAVTAITDGTANDHQLILTVSDLSTAVGLLTLTYVDNNAEVKDFGGNRLLTNSGGVPVASPPTASNVDFTGALEVGATLNGTYTYDDVNGDPENGTTFQWYSADDAGGTNKMAISGATSSTYLVLAAQMGKYISFEVTPRNVTETGSLVESSLKGPILEPLAVTQQGVIDVDCFGSSTGGIDIIATGGASPYTYSWSNGSTTEDLSNLAAGSYTVTVTDSNSNMVMLTVQVDQPASALSGTATEQSAVSCNEQSDGVASVTASGGTAPYSYLWSTGGTGQSISNLSAGNYSVTVTDSKGCQVISNVTITEPTALNATASITNDISCNGASDAGLTVTPSGGTSPYSYAWNTGETTQSLSAKGVGTYSVTVTDAMGCAANTQLVVTAPAVLTASIQVDSEITCQGTASGQLTALAGDGTPAYAYSWSTGATTSTISGLVAGTYTVTITDANGCTEMATVTLADAPELKINTIREDSGLFRPNGQTKDNTLEIYGEAGAGYTVELFLDGMSIGTTIADANGDWIFDYGAVMLTDGTYSLTAKVDGQCTSNVFQVILDATPPVMVSGSKVSSILIDIQFSEDILSLGIPKKEDFTVIDCKGDEFKVQSFLTPTGTTNIVRLVLEANTAHFFSIDYDEPHGKAIVTYNNSSDQIRDKFSNPLASDDVGVVVDFVEPYDIGHAVKVNTDAGFDINGLLGTSEAMGLIFNSDGTRLLVLAQDAGSSDENVYQMSLSIPYDLSTINYSGEKLKVGENSEISSFTFDNTGSRLFVLNQPESFVDVFSLTSSYDIRTASYEGVNKRGNFKRSPSVSRSMAFNGDGTQLTVLLNNIVGSDPQSWGYSRMRFDIPESSPYDVSTIQSESESNALRQGGSPAHRAVFFANNGDYYRINQYTENITQLNLVRPYDREVESDPNNNTHLIDGYALLRTFDIPARAMAFDHTGYKLFVLGNNIHEYKIPDNDSPKLSGARIHDTNHLAISFDEEIILSGVGPGDFLVSDCTGNTFTPTQLSSGPGITDILLEIPNLSSVEGALNIKYSPVSGSISDYYCNIAATDLTGIEMPISTASPELSNAQIETHSRGTDDLISSFLRNQEFTFSADGMLVFHKEYRGQSIRTVALNQPFDLRHGGKILGGGLFLTSGGLWSKSFRLKFNADGTKIFFVVKSDKIIYETTLATPYDFKSATSTDGSVNYTLSIAGDALDMTFNNDGTRMYILSDGIYEYVLGQPYDLSTRTLIGKSQDLANTLTGLDADLLSMELSPDGHRLLVSGGSTQRVYQFSLGTAFDTFTATHDGLAKSLDFSGNRGTPHSLEFSKTGDKLFILGLFHRDREYWESFYQYNMQLVGDIVAPQMSSATINSNTQLTVTFSENVVTNGLTSSDFKVEDSNGTVFNITSQMDPVFADNQITLNVENLFTSVGDIKITYTNNSNDVRDLNCNAMATDLTGVIIAPSGIELLRQAPISEGINVSQVIFKMTFDQEVQNVDLSDFEYVPGLGTQGAISEVTAITTREYQIKVNNISGNGTVRVAVKDNNDIVDAMGNALIVRLGVEEAYNYDIIQPGVSISSTASDPTMTSPIPIEICFDKEILGFMSSGLTVGNGTAGTFTQKLNHAFSYKLSTNGSNDGELNDPRSVAVDAAGNVFVVDRANSRVQKFSSAGTFLAKVGSSGSGNGEFSNPLAVAVNPLGNVYVLDRNNSRVQVFDNDLNYLFEFGSSGSGIGQFLRTRSLSIDSEGKVYVTDVDRDDVQIFDANGNHLLTVGSAGTADGQFERPISAVADSNGDIYVIDRDRDDVQVFNSDGVYQRKFGSSGVIPGTFNSPTGMVITSSDLLMVIDASIVGVHYFDINGAYLGTIGSSGTGNGEFAATSGLAISDRFEMYTTEDNGGNNRLQKFKLDHCFQVSIAPSANGVVTVDAAAGAFQDEFGNANTAAAQFTINTQNLPDPKLRITGDLTIPATGLGLTANFQTTFHNDGGMDLIVSNIAYPNGFNGPTSLSAIPAGESQIVTFGFSPTALQVYSGDIVVTSNGGTGTLAVSADASIVTGIDDGLLDEKSISVYPNPAGNELTVDLSELQGKPVEIAIYNINGTQKLSLPAYQERTLRLDVSQYSEGLYLMIFNNGKTAVKKKVMIRR